MRLHEVKVGPRIARFTQIVLFLCLGLSTHAEILDRIVAVVDGRIITLSDLRQERNIRAQLSEKAIDDDLVLTKQLIDAFLIEQQISDYPNIDVSNADIDDDLQKLASRAVASDALRNGLRRRIRIQKFFDLKFRQFIRPTDDEIRKYYDEVFVPEARARGVKSIAPLTDPEMTNGIRENVIQESLDHEVDVWLEAIRRRSNIELFQ
jgi:hypothetical protein